MVDEDERIEVFPNAFIRAPSALSRDAEDPARGGIMP